MHLRVRKTSQTKGRWRVARYQADRRLIVAAPLAALAATAALLSALAQPAAAQTAPSHHAGSPANISRAAQPIPPPPPAPANMLKPAAVRPNITVYHVTEAGYLSTAHKCEQLGTDPDGITAVQCADIYAEPAGKGGAIFVIPVAEQYCEEGSASNLVTCDQAQIGYSLYSTGPVSRAWGTGYCSYECAYNARNEWINYGNYYELSSCSYSLNGPNQVWSDLDDPDGSYIETTDGIFSATSNFASNHVIACP
jgi:hypothetical protein